MLAVLLLAPAIAVLPLDDVDRAHPGVSVASRLLFESALVSARQATAVAPARLDPALAAVRVRVRSQPSKREAKALGKAARATHLLVGAFRATSERVTLWTRLVETKRGRVVATSTETGPPGEMPVLVGRAADKLAARVGIRLNQASAPPVRSLHVIELWGEAQQAEDARKKLLLEQALDEDPACPFVQRALEQLMERMPRKNPFAWAEQAKTTEAARARLHQALAGKVDPARLHEQYVKTFAELERARRYRTLIAEATAVVSEPPPPVAGLSEQLPESAQLLIVLAWERLNDEDALLREGQRFLAAYPLSDNFVTVRQIVDEAFARRRRRAEGEPAAAHEIAKLPEAERRDPCRTAPVYAENAQVDDAARAYEACLARPGPHENELARAALVSFERGDFAGTVRLVERLRKLSPARGAQLAGLIDQIPVDD